VKFRGKGVTRVTSTSLGHLPPHTLIWNSIVPPNVFCCKTASTVGCLDDHSLPYFLLSSNVPVNPELKSLVGSSVTKAQRPRCVACTG
jgi:hypothetical protein